jgi:hypothetical protein
MDANRMRDRWWRRWKVWMAAQGQVNRDGTGIEARDRARALEERAWQAYLGAMSQEERAALARYQQASCTDRQEREKGGSA